MNDKNAVECFIMAVVRSLLFFLFATIFLSGCEAVYYDMMGQLQGEPTKVVFVRAGAAGAGDGSSWDDAFADLQAGIEAAAADPSKSEVWVAAGSYSPTSDVHSIGDNHFSLRNGVAVYGGFDGVSNRFEDRDPSGNATILDGQNTVYHVFYHPDSAVDTTAVLDGVTIQNGNANGGTSPHHRGGGMYNYKSTPTLRNCVFEDNQAPGSGANGEGAGLFASVFSDTTMTISNCTFTGNSSTDSGGAVHIVLNETSSCTITNSTFSGNYSKNSNAHGGAVYIEGSAGSTPAVTITGSTFNGNYTQSNASGGAVYMSFSSGGTATVSSSTFHGNYTGTSASTGNGGALAISGGGGVTAQFLNSTFTRNGWDGADICNGHGGAVSSVLGAADSVTFDGCTFGTSSNGNYSQSGGALYLDGAATSTVKNCTFTDNETNNHGGAVYTSSHNANRFFYDSTFTHNRVTNASQIGGALCLTIPSGKRNVIRGVTFTQNSAAGNGGAILASVEGALVVYRSIFDGNESTGENGGGIYFTGDGSAAVMSSLFVANEATSGGGMYCNAATTVVLVGVTFWENLATGSSGDFYLNSATTQKVYNTILKETDGNFTINTYIDLGSDTPLFVNPSNPAGADGVYGTADDGLQLSSGDTVAKEEGEDAYYDEDSGSVGIDLDGDGTQDQNMSDFIDLRGNPRAVGTVDIGAYEVQ